MIEAQFFRRTVFWVSGENKVFGAYPNADYINSEWREISLVNNDDINELIELFNVHAIERESRLISGYEAFSTWSDWYQKHRK